MKRFQVVWLMSLGFIILSACGLAELPEKRLVPTPLPTARPWEINLAPSGKLVFDPISDVVPRVDTDIAGLVKAVSEQQLKGYVQTLESFGTRNIFSSQDDASFGVGAAQQWIYSEFSRVGNGRLQVEYQDFPVYYAGFNTGAKNVVATLPGTADSNDAIVMMAHYDTRPEDATDGESLAPGANDNGAGVALLLETARVMSSRQWQQDIIFVATAAEEQGTLGAKQFVQESFLGGTDVVAAINYDGIGGERGIPQSIRLFAPNLHQSPSGDLARYYDFVAGLYVPKFPIDVLDQLDRDGRYGDHREFVNVGIPGIRLTQSVENPDLLNSRRDTWQRVDYNYLQQVVQMNVAVVANLAGAPDTPEVPLIRAMTEPGNYQLNWTVDPQAAGYVIAFRPTSEGAYPTFKYVRALEAGNVALTGFNPDLRYAVSMSALDEYGRVSDFSDEVIIEPLTEADLNGQ